ncbi:MULTISPECIES: hypothetical protein [Natrialbaceae]|uniref:hypothetical protein n=1 Tax=Natrialbaceae TaxID=1644061 RepID=UPI00207C2DB5|nr:hypothetical protein [Natronococcus sp. CG52]
METQNWHHGFENGFARTLSDFLEPYSPTIVVKDSQLQKRGQHARAQLRTVPFFQLFGFNSVIHAEIWDNQYKMVDYEPTEPAAALERVDDLSFPLVHIVTQEGITEYGEEELVRRLVRRSIEEGGEYVLVTDTVSPTTPTYTKKPGKSLPDEFVDMTVKDYAHLSNTFLREYLDSRLPVVETRNLFLHATSTIHNREGAPASSIEELFDYTKAPSQSPVWESVEYFLRHDLESVLEDYSEHIREALRSWMERGDTQKVANHILETLQVCNYDETELETYRQRNPQYR